MDQDNIRLNYDPNLGKVYLSVRRLEGQIVYRSPITTMYDYAAEYAIEELMTLNQQRRAKGIVTYIMEKAPGQKLRVIAKAYRTKKGNIVTKELTEF